MADKKWAQKAFKPSRKGLLHRELGVPEDQKIPAAKMNAALRGSFGKKNKQRAQAAHNINE